MIEPCPGDHPGKAPEIPGNARNLRRRGGRDDLVKGKTRKKPRRKGRLRPDASNPASMRAALEGGLYRRFSSPDFALSPLLAR